MSASRVPRFELHIRPLMRHIDRHRMSRLSVLHRIDLWDYDQVRDKAELILGRLKHNMPPSPYGGPWPPEWISLFERWKDAGCPRLDFAVVSHAEIVRIAAGLITLRAQGTNAGTNYRTWLDWDEPDSSNYRFVVYEEPPAENSSDSPTPFSLEESFVDLWPGVTQVTIRHRNGTTDLPVPAPDSLRDRGIA